MVSTRGPANRSRRVEEVRWPQAPFRGLKLTSISHLQEESINAVHNHEKYGISESPHRKLYRYNGEISHGVSMLDTAANMKQVPGVRGILLELNTYDFIAEDPST